MDLVIILLLIATIIHTELRFRWLRKTDKLEHGAIGTLLRARQSSIKQQRIHQQNPDVDFQPKTVKRDSDDIPLTGRVGRISTLRRDSDESSDGTNG